jgi:hypothetical protein
MQIEVALFFSPCFKPVLATTYLPTTWPILTIQDSWLSIKSLVVESLVLMVEGVTTRYCSEKEGNSSNSALFSRVNDTAPTKLSSVCARLGRPLTVGSRSCVISNEVLDSRSYIVFFLNDVDRVFA